MRHAARGYAGRAVALARISLMLCLLLAGAAGDCLSADAAAGLPELAARVTPAFVFIAGGSGVLISDDGLIITNSHVVEQGDSFGVSLGDGRSFRARLVGRDRRGDLALLKIDGASDLPHLPLGDSASIHPGQPCLAVGNPLSLGMDDRVPSFSYGVISALHQFRQNYSDAIVIDAAINPGNSGGPLLNMAGELIGINGMTQTRIGMKSNTGVGYAIPINQLKLWLPLLHGAAGGDLLHGRVTGLELEEAGEEGVRVRTYAPGSPETDTGFRAGDIIVSMMGRFVANIARFNSIQGIYPAGHRMEAIVRRGGEEVALSFALPPLRPWRQALILARPKEGERYPVVQTVIAGGVAERAGLRAGDEIVSIDSQPVRAEAIDHISRYFSGLCAGDAVSLRVRRGAGGNGADNLETISFVAE